MAGSHLAPNLEDLQIRYENCVQTGKTSLHWLPYGVRGILSYSRLVLSIWLRNLWERALMWAFVQFMGIFGFFRVNTGSDRRSLTQRMHRRWPHTLRDLGFCRQLNGILKHVVPCTVHSALELPLPILDILLLHVRAIARTASSFRRRVLRTPCPGESSDCFKL